MKKNKLKIIILFILCTVFIFSGCDTTPTNSYKGGEILSFSNWTATDKAMSVMQQGTETFIQFDKQDPEKAYSEVESVINGNLSAFRYVVFCIRSSYAMNVSVDLRSDCNNDNLTNGQPIPTSSEEKTFAYQIKVPTEAEKVTVKLIPRAGEYGMSVNGTLIVAEAYFSVECPENITIIEDVFSDDGDDDNSSNDNNPDDGDDDNSSNDNNPDDGDGDNSSNDNNPDDDEPNVSTPYEVGYPSVVEGSQDYLSVDENKVTIKKPVDMQGGQAGSYKSIRWELSGWSKTQAPKLTLSIQNKMTSGLTVGYKILVSGAAEPDYWNEKRLTMTAGNSVAWENVDVMLPAAYEEDAVTVTALELFFETAGTGEVMVELTFPGSKADVDAKTKLYEKYDPYNIKIGAAFNYGNLNNYDDIAGHFNSFTCENEMKWVSTEPQNGNYTFENADAMVRWAKAHNMKVRGHTLVWHTQTPEWVWSGNREQTLANIDDHIETMLRHFNAVDDTVYCWDVVNEALDDNDSNQNETYRKSGFYNSVGSEEYIAHAFKKADAVARQIGSDVQLFYNDYNLDNPNKRAKAVKLIEYVRAEGGRIDGIGMQGHYKMPTFKSNLANFEESIKTFTGMGLDVQLTELDLSIYAWQEPGEKPFDESLEQEQAKLYGEIFRILRKYSTPWKEGAGVVTGATFWGVADDYTWLDSQNQAGGGSSADRKDYPLLFDIYHQPKKAFYAVFDF